MFWLVHSALARDGAGGAIIMERWREKVVIDEFSIYMSYFLKLEAFATVLVQKFALTKNLVFSGLYLYLQSKIDC